jgi:hypothetical protein
MGLGQVLQVAPPQRQPVREQRESELLVRMMPDTPISDYWYMTKLGEGTHTLAEDIVELGIALPAEEEGASLVAWLGWSITRSGILMFPLLAILPRILNLLLLAHVVLRCGENGW